MSVYVGVWVPLSNPTLTHTFFFISISFKNKLTCKSYASQKAIYACPVISLFVKSKIFPGYVETHIEKILHLK